MANNTTTVSKRDQDLKVGDMVRVIGGVARITKIRPYTGPLTDIVFAIAETVGTAGSGFSLCHGGYTDVVEVAS